MLGVLASVTLFHEFSYLRLEASPSKQPLQPLISHMNPRMTTDRAGMEHRNQFRLKRRVGSNPNMAMESNDPVVKRVTVFIR
jgi:hypothetical protein